MPMSYADALKEIKKLFNDQLHAVLSTQKDSQPYASVVLFAATSDLNQILFLTPNTTRKYNNLISSPKAAMLISNHQNRPEDFQTAISVTSTGMARTISGEIKQTLLNLYLERHPQMKAFADLPTTEMISIDVDTHFVVTQFQDVTKIKGNA